MLLKTVIKYNLISLKGNSNHRGKGNSQQKQRISGGHLNHNEGTKVPEAKFLPGGSGRENFGNWAKLRGSFNARSGCQKYFFSQGCMVKWLEWNQRNRGQILADCESSGKSLAFVSLGVK